jgi:hypothetical protein
MAGFPDHLETEKGPDGVYVGGVGKSDDDMLVPQIVRPRLEAPAGHPIKKSAGKTGQGLHGSPESKEWGRSNAIGVYPGRGIKCFTREGHRSQKKCIANAP